MSTLNRVWDATRRTAKKIADKAENLADTATTTVKIKSLEMRIDEQYENLGRIIYRDLHTEEDLEEEKLRVIAAIDALFDRIAELKNKATEEADDEQATEADAAPEEAAEPAEEATPAE